MPITEERTRDARFVTERRERAGGAIAPLGRWTLHSHVGPHRVGSDHPISVECGRNEHLSEEEGHRSYPRGKISD